MAGKENLKPFTSDQSREEAVANGRKGGKKSGEAKRAKKTIREIVEIYLSTKIKGNEEMVKLAKKAGISEDATIKELISAACLLNTMAKGDVEDLAKVASLIGESGDSNERNALDRLCDALKGVTDG
jgi:hypothetical protein